MIISLGISVKRDIDERGKEMREAFQRGRGGRKAACLFRQKPLPRPFAIDLRPLAITIVTR